MTVEQMINERTVKMSAALGDANDTISAMGGTPSADLYGLAAAIASIPQGGGDEPDLVFVIDKHFDDELSKMDVSIATGTIADVAEKIENGNAKCVVKYHHVGAAGYSVTYGEITDVMVERYDTSVIFSYSYTLSGGSICVVKIDCRTDGTIFDVYKQQGSLNRL